MLSTGGRATAVEMPGEWQACVSALIPCCDYNGRGRAATRGRTPPGRLTRPAAASHVTTTPHSARPLRCARPLNAR
jgi:hypothetical protein